MLATKCYIALLSVQLRLPGCQHSISLDVGMVPVCSFVATELSFTWEFPLIKT